MQERVGERVERHRFLVRDVDGDQPEGEHRTERDTEADGQLDHPELVGRGRRIDRRGVDRSGGRPTPILWLAA